jgi:hypothetical protein
VSYSAVQACGIQSPEPKLQVMRRHQISFAAGVVLGIGSSGLLGLLACEDAAERPALVCPTLSSECPALVPSYANEVAPILAAHCGQCHTRENPSGPWPLDDPLDIAEWATSIQADLSECLMPPPDADAPLSDADRETLHAWLSCGAPAN